MESKTGFLISRAKLCHAFNTTPILYHFDFGCHIWIVTDVSGPGIKRNPSPLTSDDLGYWHLVFFFF